MGSFKKAAFYVNMRLSKRPNTVFKFISGTPRQNCRNDDYELSN